MFDICFAQNYKNKLVFSIIRIQSSTTTNLIWRRNLNLDGSNWNEEIFNFESSEFEMMIWMVALVQKTHTVHSQLELMNLLVLTLIWLIEFHRYIFLNFTWIFVIKYQTSMVRKLDSNVWKKIVNCWFFSIKT